jgi:predicted dithiol-disulfide oxidoreductase (DUF899 family)
MDAKTETLIPADQLARDNPIRMPNESADYRAARQALLAEEFELRRQIERVAAMRRALPPGGALTGDYRFETEDGPSDLAGLFGDKQTLVVYNYMFGPERKRPCPMCTNLLDAWDGNADDIAQRVSLVVVARSPLERLAAVKRGVGRTSGWRAHSPTPSRATMPGVRTADWIVEDPPSSPARMARSATSGHRR